MKKKAVLAIILGCMMSVSVFAAEIPTEPELAPDAEETVAFAEDIAEETAQLLSVETQENVMDITLTLVHGTADAGDDIQAVAEGAVSYAWQTGEDSENFAEISDADAAVYTIKNKDAGKWLRCAVTDAQGQTSYSEVVQIGRAYPSAEERPNYQGANFNKLIKKTPQQYVFALAGSEKKFVLLNSTDNAQSKYFVVAYDDYGKQYFDSEKGSGLLFNPERPSNIAYFLNHDLVDSSSDYEPKLPEQIVQHINFEQSWKTHRPGTAGTNLEPYRVTCGVALLSKEEFKEYCDNTVGAEQKLGVFDNINGGTENAAEGWMLRSARNPYGTLNMMLSPNAAANMKDENPGAALRFVRPAFYLDENFFREVRLNLSDTGDDVLNILRGNYSRSELAEIYSSQELIQIFGADVLKITDYSVNRGANTAQLSVSLENLDVFDISASVIAVMYDRDGSMVSVGNSDVKLAPESSAVAEVTVPIPQNAEGARLSFFVWDSVENQISLSDTIEIP